METLVSDVLSALKESKNVLLYGPPGTGKTWLVSKIISYLKEVPENEGRPSLRLGDGNKQFGLSLETGKQEFDLKGIDVEWITFHQNYSYEEFIIGKRPVPLEGGVALEPFFGILMSIAIKVKDSNDNKGCLLIIDEINRANASQVFGEFITLLDPAYRSTINEIANDDALNVKLPGIAYKDGVSEPIRMLRGDSIYKLQEDWTFPEHVYVLATMNSIDKAALPLDSALTRRFYKINMRPDISLLCKKLDINLNNLSEKVIKVREDNDLLETLTASETLILLLDRLNIAIASDMGEDFELGHALVWKVVDAKNDDKWSALIKVWDHNLLPQLLERYAGRNEVFRDILKITPDSPTSKVFSERKKIGGLTSFDAPLTFTPLSSLGLEQAQKVLRILSI